MQWRNFGFSCVAHVDIQCTVTRILHHKSAATKGGVRMLEN